MPFRALQRFLLVFLFVAFSTASMGSTAFVPCSASAAMGSMQGDSGETAPCCKDMGAACVMNVSCVSLIVTPGYDLDLTGELSTALTRRSPLVTLPNGLVIEPHPTPPIHFA